MVKNAYTRRRAHARISARLLRVRTSLRWRLLAEVRDREGSSERSAAAWVGLLVHVTRPRQPPTHIGFDNAHIVPAKGSRFKKRPKAMDHWHRTETDEGRLYAFKDAEHLIDDFFDEVERVLKARGVPFDTVEVIEGDRP